MKSSICDSPEDVCADDAQSKGAPSSVEMAWVISSNLLL